MDNKTVVYNNFPIFGILGIVFIVLKLTGNIAWSWWWVTAPFWAPLAAVICLSLFFVIGGSIFIFIAYLIDKIRGN